MNELNATILKIIAVLTASFALITFLDYEIYSDTTSKHSYPKRNDIGVRKLKDTLTLHSRMGENERIDVFHNVAPSVVFIDTLKEVQIGDKKEPQQKWKKNKDAGDSMKRLQMQWKKNQDRLKRQDIPDSFTSPQSSGTGFVWDAEGHIITNAHVVADASVVEVSLLTKKNVEGENAKLYPTSLLGRDPGIDEYNWRVVKAKVIGSDPGSDIAVIKIDAPQFDIHPVVRGDDNNVMIGADCLAIGNPYGLDHTLTRGIISAKGRVSHSDSGLPITNLIQTDASINHGNSGGPLLNSAGKVIGMNSMVTTASAGIGLAIPISTIAKVSHILLQKGKVARPNFGVTFNMGVQAALGIARGALVYSASDASKKAGLIGTTMALDGSIQLGDIILSINDVDVDSDVKAYSIVDDSKNEKKLNLKILRRMKDKYVHKFVTVTLE